MEEARGIRQTSLSPQRQPFGDSTKQVSPTAHLFNTWVYMAVFPTFPWAVRDFLGRN